MHGAVEHHRGGHAFKAERANEGCRLPVSMRHRYPATLAPCRPAVTPRHLGRGARLVDEDKPRRLQVRLGVEPGLPAAQDVSSLLLGRVRGFF